MNTQPKISETRRRAGFDAELDRLVVQEVEALAARAARQPAVAASTARTTAPDSNDAAPRPASAANGKVVGLARASAASAAKDLPFSAEEETFIENAVAFLRGRANADLIAEEIWQLAAGPAGDIGEDATAADAGNADEAGEEPGSDLGSFDEVPAATAEEARVVTRLRALHRSKSGPLPPGVPGTDHK